jgi:hypothetical protein
MFIYQEHSSDTYYIPRFQAKCSRHSLILADLKGVTELTSVLDLVLGIFIDVFSETNCRQGNANVINGFYEVASLKQSNGITSLKRYMFGIK